MINDGKDQLEAADTERLQVDVFRILEQMGISRAKWLEQSLSVIQDAAAGE